MTKRFKQSGFSLTEVLMAAGILAVGFMLILGLFPVSVQMTAKATERTMGAVASDEAFAKIGLFGVDATKARQDMFVRFDLAGKDGDDLDLMDLETVQEPERFYPSDEDAHLDDLKYHWSAIGKLVGPDPNDNYPVTFDDYYNHGKRSNSSILMTVFVCRIANVNSRYVEPDDNVGSSDYGSPTSSKIKTPEPVRIRVDLDPVTGFEDRLRIDRDLYSSDDRDFIAKDAVLMNDKTGKLFRVVDSYFDVDYIYLVLEKKFDWYGDTEGYVWLIPPAEGSDRSSCVGVYQRIMRF